MLVRPETVVSIIIVVILVAVVVGSSFNSSRRSVVAVVVYSVAGGGCSACRDLHDDGSSDRRARNLGARKCRLSLSVPDTGPIRFAVCLPCLYAADHGSETGCERLAQPAL